MLNENGRLQKFKYEFWQFSKAFECKAALQFLSTYLFIKLDECWLKKLLNLCGGMVGVLSVTQTLTSFSLLWHVVLLKLLWKSVERHDNVSGVSDLLKFDMWDLLMVHIDWVMSWDITWEFWEVWCSLHVFYLICLFYRKMQVGSLKQVWGLIFYITILILSYYKTWT